MILHVVNVTLDQVKISVNKIKRSQKFKKKDDFNSINYLLKKTNKQNNMQNWWRWWGLGWRWWRAVGRERKQLRGRKHTDTHFTAHSSHNRNGGLREWGLGGGWRPRKSRKSNLQPLCLRCMSTNDKTNIKNMFLVVKMMRCR